MKHVCAALAALAWTAGLAAAQGTNGHQDSRIEHVVVYPENAEVTRVKEAEVAVGLGEVVFGGLVAQLDTDSLRASSEDGVEVVGIETRTKYLTEPLSRQLAEIERKIEEQSDVVEGVQRALARIVEERAFYASIRQTTSESIQRSMKGETPSVEDWQEILGFVRKGLEELDGRQAELEKENRSQRAILEKLQRERGALAGRRPEEMKEVRVTVRSARAGAVEVRLHYLVADAGWQPTYDVHLDSGDERVLITGYGLVHQNSGEGWEEVRLTLARARPEFRLDVPELQPVVVQLDGSSFQQIQADIAGLNRASESGAWLRSRFKNDQELQNFYLNVNELANCDPSVLRDNGIDRSQVEIALERLLDRFSGVRYELSKTETIQSDRTAHKVVVSSELLPAAVEYVVSPSTQGLVIRRAEIKNATRRSLLEGTSSVFVDGSFVGGGLVPSASPNESFALFFGPDDQVRVERSLVDRQTQGPERFRQSQLVTYEFAVEIENFRDEAVTVELTDQIPISRNDNVQVKFLGATGDVAPDEKGTLTWKIDLAAGERKKVVFEYQVEHPVGLTPQFR